MAIRMASVVLSVVRCVGHRTASPEVGKSRGKAARGALKRQPLMREGFMLHLLLFAAVCAWAGDAPQPKLEAADLGIPFQRYTTTDSLGRTITFYLSMPPKGQPAGKLPVALLVQGSGCHSLFRKRGEMIYGGQQNLLLNAAKGRVRVLAVEKPGVAFCDEAKRPGSAEGASEELLKEHTLPRWAEANRAALWAAWTLPDVDRA